jgi:hypothetical protein
LNFVFFCSQERSIVVEKAKERQKPFFDRKDFPGSFEVETPFHGRVGVWPSDPPLRFFASKC